MCGRFAMTMPISALVKKFNIEQNVCHADPGYNIAPGRDIAAIIRNNTRQLVQFKWGLVPHWAKDPSIGNKMINARAESIHQKPSFKKPFKRQRCLIVASGFYEWRKAGKEKIPVYIRMQSEELFCFAGLYDFWQTNDGRRLGTCTIITTEASAAIKAIHHRMPVIIKSADQRHWLDCENQERCVLPLLKPYENDDLVMYPVSKVVNSPGNDSPECIKPLDKNS